MATKPISYVMHARGAAPALLAHTYDVVAKCVCVCARACCGEHRTDD